MKRMVVAIFSVPTQQIQSASLDARKGALKEAVDKALQLTKQELLRLGEVKKPYGLFLAPEYFMAQPLASGPTHGLGDRRHMDEAEKDRQLAEFKKISNDANGLIIVPGTIAWRKPFLRTPAKMVHSKGPNVGQAKTESRLNRAVSQVQAYANRMNFPSDYPLSGPLGVVPAPTTQSKLNLLQATLLEQPTYMARNTAYVLYDGQVTFKYNKRGDFHEVLAEQTTTVHIPGILDGRFQVKTEGPGASNDRPIDFGIEICVDHVYQTAARDIPNIGQVDIHILTSAYVEHHQSNLAIRSGGYVAHACSQDAHSTVEKLSKGIFFLSDSLNGDGPFKTETVNGCPLKLWTIELDLSKPQGSYDKSAPARRWY